MIRLIVLIAALATSGMARADCTPQEGQLRTTRTLLVNTIGGSEIGSLQYSQSLDLNDKEIVFSFDDGPHPENTPQILDILDSHCVMATFFLVGLYVERHPELVREIVRRGHNIANHTYSHPLLHRRSLASGLREIERGQAAIDAALVETDFTSQPFFRLPGLNDTTGLKAELARRNIAVMSCDFGSDDWRRISSDEVYRRSLRNIEARGSGMIIMHDTQSRIVAALPRLLDTLQERGYNAVHIQGVN